MTIFISIILHLQVKRVYISNQRKFVGVLKDITWSKKRELYVDGIAKIQSMYISDGEQQTLFDAIVELLLEYTDSEYGFIGAILHNESQQPYLTTYSIGKFEWQDDTKIFHANYENSALDTEALEDLISKTVRTSEVVIANEINNDADLSLNFPNLHSYLGVPIMGKDGLIAMYGLVNTAGDYDEEVVEDLNAISIVITTIIESSRHTAIIEKMAKKDPLTGVYNRFYFKTYVSEILRQRNVSNVQDKFCIMLMDLNKFKEINDVYGHECGDHILQAFTSRLHSKIKQLDLLARIGGDEFVLLIDGIVDLNDAGRIAKRIVELSLAPYNYNHKNIECSASVGVAVFPEAGNTIDALLRHADLALYKAKNSQEDYSYFSRELHVQYIEQQKIEQQIQQAFVDRDFYLMFQPQISLLADQKIIGAEALLRWEHPKHGARYLPENYLKIIEKMGKSEQLNIYVIEEAIKLFEGVEVQEKIHLSINVSPYPAHLEKNIREMIVLINNSSLLQKVNLTFEILESKLLSKKIELHQGSKINNLLKENNIGLLLDDFGMENSSISRLVQCGVCSIKIDMSFIQQLDKENHRSTEVIIESIIHIAKGLQIMAIAEGVETQEQLEKLKKLGCEIVQGYYFYHPLPFKDFIELLT